MEMQLLPRVGVGRVEHFSFSLCCFFVFCYFFILFFFIFFVCECFFILFIVADMFLSLIACFYSMHV